MDENARLSRPRFMAARELVADDENEPIRDAAILQFVAGIARNRTRFSSSSVILKISPESSPQDISPSDPAAAGSLAPPTHPSWMAMGIGPPQTTMRISLQSIHKGW